MIVRQGSVVRLRTLQLAAVGMVCGVLFACGGDKSASTATPSQTPEKVAAAVVDGAIVTSPNDSREYATMTLENGLEVVLVSDPEVEKSAAALSVGVGLLFDPMDYQGMAHYLEHMLFLGTSKYPTPDEYMEFMSQNGGSNNAYTWLDVTNYMFEVKNSAYDEALDRFADFFKTPKLDPTYIDKEKNAVNAEWSMRREMDYFAMYKLDRAMLGDHPANRFLIGNLESLADKDGSSLHEATVDFYNRYYSANIMKLALISDRPVSEMKQLVRTYFGDIKNKEIVEPEVDSTIDFEQAAGKLIHFVPQQDQRMLQLDFIIENNMDAFRVKPSEYLGYIIGSEMPNTPAARLKSLGWASSLNVSSSPNQYGNYGVFSISVDLTPEGMSHRNEITEMLLGFIEMLKAEGVDDRYADEFRTSLANRFRFLEKTDDFSYATQLAAAMQDYPIEHAIDAPYRFENFDAAAVQAVLDQLTPERLRIWHVSQEEEADQEMHFYAGKYAIEPLALPARDAWLAAAEQQSLALPALNTLLPESFEVAEASPEPAKVVDQDGLEIWLQGSEYFPEQPKGYTQLYINSDARIRGPEGAVLLALWEDLYQLSQTALFTEASIAGMGGSVSVAEGLRLTVSGFTDKQPELISKALAGLRITPTEQELAQAVDRFLRGLQNAKRGFPVRQLSPALRDLTRASEWDEEQLIEVAESVNREQLSAFIDGVLSRNQLRGYMFGSYSREDADALAVAIDAAMPEREAIPYQRAAVYQPEPGSTLVLNRDLPVEDLGMMYLFAAPDNSVVSEAKGQVLSAHLSNRAFSQLRTEEQLGYAAGGFATKLEDQPMVGFYIQTPVKDPAAMLERFERFKGEYREMLQALTEEEFANLKAGVITTLTQPPKNLSEEAGPFVGDWNRERYSFDSRDKLIAAAESVTLADIQTFYDATVMAENPARVLLQLRGKRFVDAPFAELPGATVVDDVSQFHANMPTQSSN
jgi:protease-3